MRWWGQNWLWLESLLVTWGLQTLMASLLWYVRLRSFGSSDSFISFHDFSSTSICCVSVVLNNSVPRTEYNNVNKTDVEDTDRPVFSRFIYQGQSQLKYSTVCVCARARGQKDGDQTWNKGKKEAWEKLSMCSHGKGISRGKVVPNIRWGCQEKTLGDSLWVQSWMMERQPQEDGKKQPNELNQQSGCSDARKKSCKTGVLYKKVEYHGLIS